MLHDDSPTASIRAASAQAGKRVDVLFAVAGGLGTLAVAGWVLTIVSAIKTDGDAVVISALLAATLSVVSTLVILTGLSRCYLRSLIDHDLAVVCRRLDQIRAAQKTNGHAPAPAPSDDYDVGNNLRSFIAGRLDAPQAHDY